jgi:hypothetical protein
MATDPFAPSRILDWSAVPQLPLRVWLAVTGVALLVLGLLAVTTYAVLRPAARLRVAHWRAGWIVGLAGAAVLPWLVVWLAPIRIAVNIRGIGPLLGWLLLALLAFALLVLLPLAALLCSVVWATARRRGGHRSPPAT